MVLLEELDGLVEGLAKADALPVREVAQHIKVVDLNAQRAVHHQMRFAVAALGRDGLRRRRAVAEATFARLPGNLLLRRGGDDGRGLRLKPFYIKVFEDRK